MSPPRFSRAFLLSAVACGLLVAVPFLLVTLPPITDLPQQAAQVRLLDETIAGSDAYRLQWLHPNKLGYVPLILAWRIAGPLAAGRLALLAIAVLWVTAVHVLARATGRTPAMATLASLFFFNHTAYWGFLNFLVGFPAFVLWFLIVRRLSAPVTSRDGLKLLLAGLLLYSAHVLWLAAALLWLVAATLLDRGPGFEAVRRLAWLGPVLIAVAGWYSTFLESGVDERTFQGRPPWVRLSPPWMLGAGLGGLRGWVEPAVALAVLGWLVLGLWQNRTRLAQAGEGRLALAGIVFLTAALGLPEVHRHTVFFAARWIAPAAVLLVLACPPPRIGAVLRNAVPWILLAALVTATAAAWTAFEEEELAGLEECLEALPPDQKVLGLTLVRTSPRIAGFPYYHLFAYAQVLRGGELNRSFADDASSLVVFRELPKEYPWTDRLDWRPERFRRSDRGHFDYILVFARPEEHGYFLRDRTLEPVTEKRPWRLYRVGGRNGPGATSRAVPGPAPGRGAQESPGAETSSANFS